MKADSRDIQAASALFRQSGWLAATPQAFSDAILSHCQWQICRAGTPVTHGGETEGGLIGLGGGSLSVVPSVGAADTPAIHVVRAPYWYGVNPLMNGLPRSTSMVAREPCVVAFVPQFAVRTLLTEHPEWWQWISLNLAEALALATQIAADLLIHDSRRRFAAVLLRVAGCRKEGSGPCNAGVGQEELAAMANMARQTAGLASRDFEMQGAIQRGYRNITITNPAILRAVVDV